MAKATRNADATRKLILEEGFREIYRRGFQGVSVREIVDKTHLTIGAFFHHFPTKNDLGYAVVDEVIKANILKDWIAPIAAHQNPIQGILSRYRKFINEADEEFLTYGCAVNNLTQEMRAVDPVFGDKLRSAVDLWINEIEKLLVRARKEGHLKKEANPRKIAEFVVAAQEGSFGLAKTFRDKKVLWAVYESLKVYLESLGVKKKQ